MVTNEIFEKALKNEYYLKIMNQSCKRYSSALDFEELHFCKLEALWKSLEKYDKSKSKFTTFLHNVVRFSCLNAINKKNKEKKHTSLDELDENYEYIDDFSFIVDIKNSLSKTEFLIIEDRFMNRMTIAEMSKKHKKSNIIKELTRILNKLSD